MVTYGRTHGDEIPVANYAIFFLITIIESKHSLILGYFLIKSLNTEEKAKLLHDTIVEVNKTGACLLTIAFDGLSTNFTTLQSMGASFDINDLKPFILNPETNQKIFVVLDPPHMLKLIRNCLDAKKCLKDAEKNDILWLHFVNLLFKKSELVSHKLTKHHIEFHSNKMNVKLAAQTLSYSVAKSMELLLTKGDAVFQNAIGTINFVKNFNKAFDIFNSKHTDSKNLFKRGLNLETREKIFEFLDYFVEYVKNLKFEGENILNTSRKTGFLGFIVNTYTLHFLDEEYVQTKKIENLLFFYFGQDMLESLFSRIRAMLGSNNNPTAEQLYGVLRQLVTYNELTAPETASCEDNLNILTVSSNSARQENILLQTSEDDFDEEFFLNLTLNFKDRYSIKMRAGTIEKKSDMDAFIALMMLVKICSLIILRELKEHFMKMGMLKGQQKVPSKYVK